MWKWNSLLLDYAVPVVSSQLAPLLGILGTIDGLNFKLFGLALFRRSVELLRLNVLPPETHS